MCKHSVSVSVFVGALELIFLFELCVGIPVFLYESMCGHLRHSLYMISSLELASTDSEAADTHRPEHCTTNRGNNRTH